MFPPHLPPPSCNIRQHAFWQRLKLILLAVSFGFLSGITGAAVLLGWIWRADYTYILGDWQVARTSRVNQPGVVAAAVAQEFSAHLATVYRRGETIAGALTFKDSEYLGDAVVVGADGWLAARLPALPRGALTWQAVVGGKARSVERVVFDPVSSLTFLRLKSWPPEKTEGRPLSAVAFADSLAPPAEVFGYRRGGWRPAAITGWQSLGFGGARLDSAPRSGFGISADWPPGTIVITAAGQLAGFVTEGGLALPGEYLAALLPALFERGVIHYPSLGIDGWFDSEAPIFQGATARSGFWVARVWGRGNPLKRGDLITEINGAPATTERWRRELKGREALVKVQREGRERELTLSAVAYEP